MEAIPPEVAERAATRYVENEAGCWITSYAIQPTGYAYIAWNGRTNGGKIVSVPVHRAAYQHHHGTPPVTGGQVDHTCHDPAVCPPGVCPHRACVNPSHLLDGTIRDNALRSGSHAAVNAAKTECPRCGGEYTVELLANGKLGRRCVPCRTAKARERWQRDPDAAKAKRRFYYHRQQERLRAERQVVA